MRKFTLLLMFVAFTAFVFAQNAQKQHTLTKSEKSHVFERDQSKTAGEVIWSEDFSGDTLPVGWSIVDLSDENMPWIWTTDTIDGAYTPNPWITAGGNPETGYLSMPADGYNSVPLFTAIADGGDLVEVRINVDSYFQTPSLDLSSEDGVVLGFYTFYRYINSMLFEVQVSNDFNPDSPELSHWDIFRVNEEYLSESNDVARDEFRQINISATAANQGNVVIRFYAHGDSHYVWLVDNVEISVPYDNNVTLNNTWAFYHWLDDNPAEITPHFEGYLQHGGFYYKIPKSHVQAFVGFQGAVQNFGMNDQTNVKMTTTITYYEDSAAGTAGTVVYTVDTDLKDLEASQYDSVYGLADFTPVDYGWYDIDMEVTFDNGDDLPENNTKHWEFMVNDSTYSRTTDDINDRVSTRDWVGGGYDGDGIGVIFSFKEEAVVEGMKWYFHGGNTIDMEHIVAGNYTYICRIYGYDEEADEWNLSSQIDADLAIIDPDADFEVVIIEGEENDTVGTWQYTEYARDGNSEYLSPGDYLIYIETTTGVDPDVETVRFRVGGDQTYAQPDGSFRMWQAQDNGWTTASANPSFHLIIEAEDWIQVSTEEVKEDPFANSLAQNWPNPAYDNTTIKYRIDQTANVTINVYDVTGKLVISIVEGTKTSGRHEVSLDISDLTSGIYYYSLNAGHFSQTKKMVIIK